MEPLPPLPAAPSRRPSLGLVQGLLLLVLAWGVIFLVSAAFMAAAMLGGAGEEELPLAQIVFVANSAGFLGVAVVGALLLRAPRTRVFPLGPFPSRILIPMVPMAIGAIFVLSEIDTLLQALPLPEFAAESMESVEEMARRLVEEAPWWAAAALVLMAPVTEEFFFRGLLLQGFLGRYAVRTALVASSILFALAHLTLNQLIPAFTLGLYLGWLTLRTGTLWPALIAHAAHNLLATVGFLAALRAGQLDAAPEHVPLWLLLPSVVAVGLSLRVLHAWLPRREVPEAPFVDPPPSVSDPTHLA